MSSAALISSSALIIIGALALWQRHRKLALAREQSIRTFVFPSSVLQELNKVYPHLQLKDLQLVARALRQFFLIHARSKGALIGMPSKATDALWHAFILDTRTYQNFCKSAFGSYFHHIPESAMATQSKQDAALWRTWRLACLEENINPSKATRLPLLYAIDSRLAIPGAVEYNPSSFKPPQSDSDSDSDSDSGCGGGDGDGWGGIDGIGDSGCSGGCGGGD